MMDKDTQVYCSQGPTNIAPLASGKLSGYQFVFKDLFDVQGYQTGAGNPKWLTSHPAAKSTSPIIIELLKQGAKCVGRVQTDELAYSLNGQNIHYGTPVNPIATDCIPGGSSSGSAVAVACGDADFSIGTDTGGSVRVPASYCGLYGLRPTLGKFDLSHCFELSVSFDTAGIFSRNLSLLRQVYDALSPEFKAPIKVRQLYLDNSFIEYFSEQRLLYLQSWCENADIELVKGDFLAQENFKLEELSELFRTIQGYEIIQLHESWLNEFGDSLDVAILERVKWARLIGEEQYINAQAQQTVFKEKLFTHLQKNDLLWVLPTTPSGPPKITMDGEVLANYRSNLMGLTSIAGLSGFPQLHLPMQGLQEGPCGISLIGLENQELQLFATGQRLSGEE
jgi:aspartyl-tRNA(Asn)/glutamyl-tRNA(Gln) amidotransferase subunit A